MMFGHLKERSMHPLEHETIPQVPSQPRVVPERAPTVALVTNVVEDGPAAEAGIKPGDVILAIDGERIQRGANLRRMLLEFRPGDRIKLTIRRANRTRDVQVRLGRHPEDESQPYLGLYFRLMPIDPD
jgi:S1-C subfamily serine protease